MSEDKDSLSNQDSVEDSQLASLNAKEASGSSKVLVYLVLAVSLISAVAYLSFYSGDFDSQQYLESDDIAAEMAAKGGASAGAGGELAVAAVDPFDAGKKVYMANCMACHQVNGQGLGDSFPPLAGSDWIDKNPALLARIVLNGLQGPITVNGNEYNSVMAPLGMALSDEDIANVLTYVRQDWGNSASAVDPQVVADARSESGTRGMWTVEELAPWME